MAVTKFAAAAEDDGEIEYPSPAGLVTPCCLKNVGRVVLTGGYGLPILPISIGIRYSLPGSAYSGPSKPPVTVGIFCATRYRYAEDRKAELSTITNGLDVSTIFWASVRFCVGE